MHSLLHIVSVWLDRQWDAGGYYVVSIGEPFKSVRSLCPVFNERVWCGYQNQIHVLNPETLSIEVRHCCTVCNVFLFCKADRRNCCTRIEVMSQKYPSLLRCILCTLVCHLPLVCFLFNFLWNLIVFVWFEAMQEMTKRQLFLSLWERTSSKFFVWLRSRCM